MCLNYINYMLAIHSPPIEAHLSLVYFLKASDNSSFKQALQSADSLNIDIKQYNSQD